MLENSLTHTQVPHTPGVYIMRGADGGIIYIGKAKDLKSRLSQYFQAGGARANHKLPQLMAVLRKIDYIPCQSERDALILERDLIRRHQPFFNAMWKDDKSYPYIKLTLNEEFPRILITRKRLNDGAKYYGPYPQAAGLKHCCATSGKAACCRCAPANGSLTRKNRLNSR